MYSYLIVALFAVLSLPVYSSPLPCDFTLTPSSTPTYPARHAHHTHSDLSVAPYSAPTDDCSDSTTSPPTPYTPPTAAPTIPATTTTPSPPPSSPTPTSSVAPPPATASAPVVASQSNGAFSGGVATYFYQNGNPGACGWYNSDSAIIAAMDQTRFGTSGPGSSLCGQKVRITNLNNNWSATVTIVDDCPTCDNENSIDLSVGAFQALEPDLSVGEFPISWAFV